jgi:hypothetical protein
MFCWLNRKIELVSRALDSNFREFMFAVTVFCCQYLNCYEARVEQADMS